MWESKYDYDLSWDLAVLAEKVGFGESNRLDETTLHGLHRWLIEEKKVYVIVNVFPTFSTIDKVFFEWEIKWGSDGANLNKSEEPLYYESSYKSALEKGIKTALEMIINGEITDGRS